MILVRWPSLALLTLVVLVGLFAVVGPATSAAARGSCTVTRPGADKPGTEPFGPGSFNYGSARIRTQIWPNGHLIAGRLPNGGYWATINPDGSIVPYGSRTSRPALVSDALNVVGHVGLPNR
jgi:hypothetical protein